jgi:hypothetical protein
MKLAAGTRLGPYEIEHAIGAGGMGVVYRADDSRLGRKVAIKILPQAHGDQFRRFEREARTIGGLNHPNLLTLFDVGEHNGMPFLVTEMLDGESLRTHLARGKMRVREAIQIAADVARGLAAAHDAGIVHRDVKPDNIFLTTTGRTKILDFGIAKLRRATMEMPVVDPAADTPTPTTRDTGVVIGTPGYMAPEQLDAGTVDERSDIFALGVVLYEMICGKRAFASDSPVEESYAILKTTPDPPKGATKSLARVVMRCLEKRKDARFQSAGDLAFALDELDASTDPISRISKVAFETDANAAITVRDRPPTVAPVPSRRGRWIAAAVLGLIACTLGGVLIGRRVASPGLARLEWPSLVEGGVSYQRVTYHTQSLWSARLAPDGKNVLYSAPRGGHEEIVRSAIGEPSIAATNVVGRLLDVSQRGELAVLTNEVPGGGTLSRAFEGAGLRPVADHVTAATFLPDDTLAVVHGGLVIESPNGTPIVKRATGRIDLLRASPSGDRLAFAEHPASGDLGGFVVVVDRTGKELVRSRKYDQLSGLAWSPDGADVWFTNQQAIYALGADAREHVVVRDSLRLVVLDAKPGKILVAPSDLRLKMFTGPTEGPYHEVGWFDSSDVESLSTDGATIAFVEASGTGQNPDGSAPCFIRRGDQPATLIGHGFRCVLVPDGTAVVAAEGPTKLTRIPTSVGAPTPIPLGNIAQLDVSDRIAISWNGRYVVVRGAAAGAENRLWRIDLEHPAAAPIAATFVAGSHPIASDGDTIALSRAAGGVALVSASGKPAHEIAGPAGETPLGFTGDDRALFVMHVEGDTIEVDRIDLATDARAKWTRITPEQAPVYYSVALDADGGVVTYSTNADASDLYVIENAAAPPPPP